MASPPPGSRRRRRFALALVLGCAAAVGGCGATAAWYVGLFTSDGRFAELDACTLLPPEQDLASLVHNGAKEPGDSRPKSWIGASSGDLGSECKWSSVPQGQDRPFRTVRIHTETKAGSGRDSGETRAREELARWHRNAVRRHGRSQVEPIDVGEKGYTATDEMTIRILASRTTIYDVHAKFRISNALVDVSARTHTDPGDEQRALLLGLAENVARQLSDAQ